MDNQILYIARDKDKSLTLFKRRPKKDIKMELWVCSNDSYSDDMFLILKKKQFPDVKWEDKQPTKVMLIKE